MFKILSASIIVIGVILIITGLWLRPFAIPKGRTGRQIMKPEDKLKDILDAFTNKKILKQFLDCLAYNKELKGNKLAARILELSEVGISLQQLYFLKTVCLLFCALLVIIIGYSNANYQIKKIVLSSETENSFLSQDNSYNESKYILYRQVVNSVGRSKLLAADDKQKYYIVKEAISESLKTSDQYLIDKKTAWFLKTWIEAGNVKVINYYSIIIILLSLLFPELLMIMRWLLRGCIYKKEIIKLEYIFELLARVDGIKTSDIIYELEKSSRIYSKYLHEFRLIFQYDKKGAFDYLKRSNIKSLSRLATVLEIYSLSDRELALQILDREVMERDESLIITSEETIDFIDLAAFLSIAPLVYELARLMLNPMLEVIYKAFEFI